MNVVDKICNRELAWGNFHPKLPTIGLNLRPIAAETDWKGDAIGCTIPYRAIFTENMPAGIGMNSS
jgi:hypothetical protein